MNDKDKIEITVGDVKRMAEKCPTAREVLKEGFPGVFEPKWEEITGEVTINRNTFRGGLLVQLDYRGCIFGSLDGSGMSIYKEDVSDYRYETKSVYDGARNSLQSDVLHIYRRTQ